MSETARQILEEALRLPPEERATVIAELIASMDGEPDADAEQAWAIEIENRARRALRGESEGRDWSSVRADMDARHRTK